MRNILRACGGVQGGSTLTQQLAKNLFLTQERTVSRKIQEVILALWLEHKFSKDQILELYLNRVYFGGGAYGVEAATQHGVVVMNTPGGNTVTTGEHAIAMMLSLARKIPQATSSMKEGKWEKNKFKITYC